MIKIITKILDLIYPPICSICGKTSKNPLCNKCKIKLKEEYCFSIDNYEKDKNKNFAEHYYLFKYKNIIRNQILALKFQEKPYAYRTITYFLKNMQKSFEKLKKYDIIIVVPISGRRKKERGYNQSELIAKEISRITKVPITKNVLYKTKHTIPQSTLNKVQREKNANGVYKVQNYQKIKNKKILLIDDIYTTGSTLNECSKELIQIGVEKSQIGVLTLAKD